MKEGGSALHGPPRGVRLIGLGATDQAGREPERVFRMTGWITRYFSISKTNSLTFAIALQSQSTTDQSDSHSGIGKSVERCLSSRSR